MKPISAPAVRWWEWLDNWLCPKGFQFRIPDAEGGDRETAREEPSTEGS